MRDKFMFFDNFKETADKLPDDLRLKFYDAVTDYVFKGIEPDDAVILALITAIKPSLDKEDRRGGVREGAGAPKNNQNASKVDDETIKNNQNNQNQSKQSILSETETRNKKQENIQSEDCIKRKKLVPDDWLPNEKTIEKLNEKGLDAEKTVEKFINSCHAKNLKYIDFDRAILAWDWSKDMSLKVRGDDECWF